MKGEQALANHAQKQKAIKNPNKVYKAGKLTSSTRFSSKRTNPKLLIVIGCVIFSILFAVILGNILGDKAHSSQNGINDSGSPSSIGAPSVDKTSPKLSLHAYFADMSKADTLYEKDTEINKTKNNTEINLFKIINCFQII
mgnify:CR=1 FL=1